MPPLEAFKSHFAKLVPSGAETVLFASLHFEELKSNEILNGHAHSMHINLGLLQAAKFVSIFLSTYPLSF